MPEMIWYNYDTPASQLVDTMKSYDKIFLLVQKKKSASP